jgi:alpha-L-fucosidase
MKQMTRRKMLALVGCAAPALSLRNAFSQYPEPNRYGINLTKGPFQATIESLAAYTIPDWFADAKFGIWSHWGPQSAIGDGDWYARNMYIQGHPQYEYHLKRFGPQSKIGYKDLIPLFTATRWNPEHLMDLYQKAGAKYFVSMGVHHDNYDMWNSKYQPRWNSVAIGPHKDIVGLWAAAARRRGMRFGVSEHLGRSYDWFAPAHLADKTGPYSGIPYDGADPAYADLYHNYFAFPAGFAQSIAAKDNENILTPEMKLNYFNRIKDLLDQHQPDILYTDGHIRIGEYSYGVIAELYNVAPVSNSNRTEGVYFSKAKDDCAIGTCVLDRERGVSDGIWPVPWQTDTCVGQWHYKEGVQYKTAKQVIDLLVDIVSKNGNLLLNFPLPASGELDSEELKTLNGITEWMNVNGEGIFSTRPWKVFGEGPSVHAATPSKDFDQNERKKGSLGPRDIRYASKGKTIYAFVQGWPKGQLVLQSLATSSSLQSPKVHAVWMLGQSQPLQFTQDGTGLALSLGGERPASAEIGIALRIATA